MVKGEDFIRLWNEYQAALAAYEPVLTARADLDALRLERTSLLKVANRAYRQGDPETAKRFSEDASAITRDQIPAVELRLSRMLNGEKEAKKKLLSARNNLLAYARVPQRYWSNVVFRFNGKYHIYFGAGQGDTFAEGHAHYVFGEDGIIEYCRERNQPRQEAYRSPKWSFDRSRS